MEFEGDLSKYINSSTVLYTCNCMHGHIDRENEFICQVDKECFEGLEERKQSPDQRN